jgi:hypothetical protein
MDFTIATYKQILQTLINKEYSFQTYAEFMQNPNGNKVILRHDVDLLPLNSLRFAKIQAELGIKGTYYFRAVPESWDEAVILEIASLGHEIGYHYENLTTCKGNLEKAITDFQFNLEKLRKLAPVSTICMHGSPLSKFDSKDLWKKYSYQDFGIIAEPYFDTDFSKVSYLTDTGRRWDGEKVSVRDKVGAPSKISVHSSFELIEAVDKNDINAPIMFTFHPQRWNDFGIIWIKELIFQNIKNTIKRFLYVKK